MKGCNLNCFWCQNPESINKDLEIQVIPFKCIGCNRCIKVCSYNARKIVDGKMYYNREICHRCGKCAEVCPSGATSWIGTEMNVKEVINKIELDQAFYKRSNGGVTFSGGEPMLQIEFLMELLKECKRKKIHTAVDTAGNVPRKYFEEILPYTDLFLYDIKLIDEQRHKRATGVGNRKILANLKRLSANPVVILIRIPVIPSVNDSIKDMEEITKFLKTLNKNYAVELLPFHQFGSGKYENLGITYKAKELILPKYDEINDLSNIFSKNGFITKIP